MSYLYKSQALQPASQRFFTTTLTFIVVADVRVSRLQVDVVLPALTFTALQPALRAHPRRNFLHVETENIMHIITEYPFFVNDRHYCGVMALSKARLPVHQRQGAQFAEVVVCSRCCEVCWVREHDSQHGPCCGNLCVEERKGTKNIILI